MTSEVKMSVIAWRYKFNTGALWHYTKHGPHEQSRQGLKWQALVLQSDALAAIEAARVEAETLRSVLQRIAAIEIDRGMDGTEAIERGMSAVGFAQTAIRSLAKEAP